MGLVITIAARPGRNRNWPGSPLLKRPGPGALFLLEARKLDSRPGCILGEWAETSLLYMHLNSMQLVLALALLAGAAPGGLHALPAQEKTPAADPDGIEFFEKKIRPLLVEKCYECHAETSKRLKGGLRLDSKAATLKGGDTGPSLVPGDPDKSLTVKAIRQQDAELKKPPQGTLTDEQIAGV